MDSSQNMNLKVWINLVHIPLICNLCTIRYSHLSTYVLHYLNRARICCIAAFAGDDVVCDLISVLNVARNAHCASAAFEGRKRQHSGQMGCEGDSRLSLQHF